jgi:hypothetical protein
MIGINGIFAAAKIAHLSDNKTCEDGAPGH